MTNKNFDFLADKNKIELAKSIEQSYWNYYFCDEWSTDDIDFHLRMKYMFGNDGKISDMANIRARHILKKWINVVQQQGLSAASLNQRLTALSMFYKFLIGDLYDLVNVVTGIPRFITDEDTNDKKKFLYMDEAKNVVKLVEQKDDKKLTAYENARNEIIIKLFLGCGLRISELSKLEYKHINIEENRIYITKDIAK